MEDPEQKILTALVAGAALEAPASVKEAYRDLKLLLIDRSKFESDIEDAIESVEQKPESEARRSVLAEEIESSGAFHDHEVNLRAADLIDEAIRGGLIQTGRDGTRSVRTGAGIITINPQTVAGGSGSQISGGSLYGDAFSREFTRQWKALVRESDD